MFSRAEKLSRSRYPTIARLREHVFRIFLLFRIGQVSFCRTLPYLYFKLPRLAKASLSYLQEQACSFLSIHLRFPRLIELHLQNSAQQDRLLPQLVQPCRSFRSPATKIQESKLLATAHLAEGISICTTPSYQELAR